MPEKCLGSFRLEVFVNSVEQCVDSLVRVHLFPDRRMQARSNRHAGLILSGAPNLVTQEHWVLIAFLAEEIIVANVRKGSSHFRVPLRPLLRLAENRHFGDALFKHSPANITYHLDIVLRALPFSRAVGLNVGWYASGVRRRGDRRRGDGS